MPIFDIGIKVLLASTFIFGVVFFFLCFGWSRMKHPGRTVNFITAIVMSFLYGFVFFGIGFLLLILISWGWEYLPDFIKLWQSFQ